MAVKQNVVTQAHEAFALGLAAYQRDQLQQAQTCLQQALQLQPQYFDVLHLLGIVEGKLQNPERSVQLLEQAIALKPDYAQTHNNLGNALQGLAQHRAAIASYDRAIALDPRYTSAHYNRGLCLQNLLQHDACIASYRRAIELEPQHADAHWNLSLCYLQLGRFDLGWPEYEWRWQKAEYRPLQRRFEKPLWLGQESLNGKTIFLHDEQGFGDTLQFCRYATLVRQLGARVIFGVHQSLFALLRPLAGVDLLISKGDVLPAFDYHCPLLSLPLALKTTLSTLPAPLGYLQSDPAKVAYWRNRLGAKTKPRIGLVYSGRPEHKGDLQRSFALADLLAYLPQDVQCISLQKEVRLADQATLAAQPQVLNLGCEFKDFSDTAALCELMDLVISVDTSVAHLAAAMGKPTWVLLPFNPDWRWLLARNDSPWYPSVRLYRQEAPGQWQGVFEQVKTDLSGQFLAAFEQDTAFDQALGLYQQGQLLQAQALLQAALQLQPARIQTLHLLGVIAGQTGQPAQALQWLDSAVALAPGHAALHASRGHAFKDLGQYLAAIDSYTRAIELQSDEAQHYSHRGAIYLTTQQYPQALADYDRAITLTASDAHAHNGRGVACAALGRYQEAVQSYDQAIAIDPKFSEAYNNRGLVLQQLGQYANAADSYGQAIALNPNYVDAHLNRGLCDLQMGNWQRGWQGHEWRWKKEGWSDFASQLPQPKWSGTQPLQGKSILLHSEQGLGDALQFCRYVQQVSALGARIILAVHQPLVGLLRQLPGVAQVLTKGDPLPAALDYHCPLMSLPAIFATQPDTVPLAQGYLRSDPAKVAYWQQRLGQKTRPRIGLVWSGSTQFSGDSTRSLALADLLPWLPSHLQYVSLKKELNEQDRMSLAAHPEIRHFGQELSDFADTAALCECVDLVLSTCTSVAHLVGAMGKPLWLLLQFNADWRWLLQRTDSPWYASAHLYRQKTAGSWTSVFQCIQRDLNARFSTESADAQQVADEFEQALACYQRGEFVPAQERLQQVLRLQAQHVQALHLLGVIAGQSGHAAQALDYLNQAVALEPNNAAVHASRGHAFKDLQQHASAIESYTQAIALQPAQINFYTSRAAAHIALEQYQLAVDDYDQALQLEPNHAQAYNNRGIALAALEQHQLALESYARSIALDPTDAQVHNNQGLSLQNLGQFSQALQSYERAVALQPDLPRACWTQALCHLQMGDFEQGWKKYESRWDNVEYREAARQFVQPLWQGQVLESQRLLVWAEQGLGDQILCLSMLPSLMQRVAHITLAVQARLVSLVQRSFKNVKVVALDALAQEQFDYQVPTMSLGQYLRTRWADFPAQQHAYLVADPERCQHWRRQLTRRHPLVCGISWLSVNRGIGAAKSMPLQALKPLLELPGIEFVDLQYGDTQQERQAVGQQIGVDILRVQEVDHFNDLEGLAALISACDVVVTVSNMTAHLAGALGQSVDIMLPHANVGLLWHWHEGRDHSPWYPSAHLYRQDKAGDWSGVCARVAQDVEQTFLQSKRYEQAAASYTQAIALQPDDASLYVNRGLVWMELEQYQAALADYDHALALHPDALTHYHRGDALRALGQDQAALGSYDSALAGSAHFAQLHYNRANTLSDLGHYEAAITSYQRALTLDPDDVGVHWNLSWCYLRLGRFDLGWPEYEWRWRTTGYSPVAARFTEPLWSGTQPLQGKTIFLHYEQGLGDTLQFCRYAQWVHDLGAHVILGVQRPLLTVCKSLSGVDTLITDGDVLPAFDYHCPLMSLPLAFNTRSGSHQLPAPHHYLQSDPAKVADWQMRLGAKTQARVGLVYSGRPEHKNDAKRSIALADILPHLPPGGQYISLQKEVKPADQATLDAHPEVLHFGAALQDFADTAALCELVDVIISVDTSVAHLAAAMGKPVWILLPSNADWRWLVDRSDSPWYPSVRLYRQARGSDWQAVLQQLGLDLQQWATTAVVLQDEFARALQLHQQGQLAQAQEHYERLLQVQPKHVAALHALGVLAYQAQDDSRCVDYFNQVLHLDPAHALAYTNRGAARRRLKQYHLALEDYDRALALKPGDAIAHFNRGNLLGDLEQYEAALQSYDRAIALRRDAQTYINRAESCKRLKRYSEAVDNYEQALTLEPEHEFLLGALLHTQMQICDWHDFDQRLTQLLTGVQQGLKVSMPFAVLALSSSLSVQRQAAQTWVRAKCPAHSTFPPIAVRVRHSKIRLGYYSADYHNHATTHLMAELFERHDKNRFELVAFSFGPERDDVMRQRVAAAFDTFVDVRHLSDLQVAELSRKMQIDIAIDLKGFTQDGRTGIFACRAAPVQVSYMGYLGTMGAEYMDYLVADATLIAPDSRLHYSEKIAYLPNSFQVNDAKRAISDRVFTRQELGLPASGFVFCCLNNNYKITPSTFAGWMRVLQQVQGSVLWLFEDNPAAASNLRQQAGRAGVDPTRLVFAPPLSAPEHLARYRIADLFLDTLPCNAGATASDALWAGLPVLTCTAPALASRVAASLLTAIGLPELITATQDTYEALAVELAQNPQRLQALRRKLEQNKHTMPLFDSKLLTHHLEDAYAQMYERYQAGLPPDHIGVSKPAP